MLQRNPEHSIYAQSPTSPFLRAEGSLLISVAQPGSYAYLEHPDVMRRAEKLGKPHAIAWESHTYPARGAVALGVLPNAKVLVPDTDGMGVFLSGFHDVREYYNLGTPVEAVLVPWDLHEPPDTLDAAILRHAPDVADHLRRTHRQTEPIRVVTHATTPDTQAWIADMQGYGIDVSSLFQTKGGERPSYGYRHGFASHRLEDTQHMLTFVERYGIPAARGIIAYSETEARRAYETVASISGSDNVYTKLDESGGGVYLGQDESVEAVAKRFKAWEEAGKLSPIYGHTTPVEIQAAIPGIVTIGSFQYVGHEIVTPGPGYTTQVVDGTIWQGNIYNDDTLQGVPANQQRGVQSLIYEFQERFMEGVRNEEEGYPVGGVDFAIAQISRMPNPEVFIPRDLLVLAQQLNVDYMPVAIEHNGLRASDALWPALFAEQVGVGDRPFMARYISPVTSTLREAWQHMLSQDLQYTHERGSGIIPMSWIHDNTTAIHSGMVLVVGERPEDLADIYIRAAQSLRGEGFIGDADSPDNV